MAHVEYYFSREQNAYEFVIEDYNHSRAFASFLPGIAGQYGIPLWAFYVNRGQCISSFGVRDKDASFLEFFPADKAYQLVSLRGFRTFLKVTDGEKSFLYEPFHYDNSLRSGVMQRMFISSHALRIEEHNPAVQLKTTVEFFTLPSSPLAGLVRQLKIENTADSARTIACVDGLPQVVPYGLNYWCMKYMSRTMEAFMHVVNRENGIPYMQMKIYPSDIAEVIKVIEGNFFLGFSYEHGTLKKWQPIVDPCRVFGDRLDFVYPQAFAEQQPINTDDQVAGNQNPSAFYYAAAAIPARSTYTIYGLFGHAHALDDVMNYVSREIAHSSFYSKKREENKMLIDDIKQRAFVLSNNVALNEYATQTYLDNTLRGGCSMQISEKVRAYVYGRKHGDLERDYNNFFLLDTNFSQGNGDFRDVLQNRRCDVLFNPQSGVNNIKYFFNLIQLDGYNPLIVRNTRFLIRESASVLASLAQDSAAMSAVYDDIQALCRKEFTIGQLWKVLIRSGADQHENKKMFDWLLARSEEIEDAEFEKGYWIDHWTYLLDLIEQYAAVFPEKIENLLLHDTTYIFYDTDRLVLPRDQKYILTESGVRQYNSVTVHEEKKQMLEERKRERHRMRIQYGKGAVYTTNLLVKIVCIAVNKMASLDPFCRGVEMEADKPGWCDALNGLPGLLGSSLNETMELYRLMAGIQGYIGQIGSAVKQVSVPIELSAFFQTMKDLLPQAQSDPCAFWDASHTAKETYRAAVVFGIHGDETVLSIDEVLSFFKQAQQILTAAIASSVDPKTELPYTYFINEAAAYTVLPGQEKKKRPHVRVTQFTQRPLVLFLEGIVHRLKIEEDERVIEKVYRQVQKTELYDKKLGMYRMNVSLESEPDEIGREKIFNYGWLENGSIFLHMHYKYVLEMVRKGLIEEFYKNMSFLLIPFRNPQEYGRSSTENVSFVVCSGYAVNPQDHGRGYVARLSGSTVEFLQIASLLLFGPKPFFLDEQKNLILAFNPQLHRDLFLEKETTIVDPDDTRTTITVPAHTVSFRFLGHTLVYYHNPQRKNTYGTARARIARMTLVNKQRQHRQIEGSLITGLDAHAVRNGDVSSIHVYLE